MLTMHCTPAQVEISLVLVTLLFVEVEYTILIGAQCKVQIWNAISLQN